MKRPQETNYPQYLFSTVSRWPNYWLTVFLYYSGPAKYPLDNGLRKKYFLRKLTFLVVYFILDLNKSCTLSYDEEMRCKVQTHGSEVPTPTREVDWYAEPQQRLSWDIVARAFSLNFSFISELSQGQAVVNKHLGENSCQKCTAIKSWIVKWSVHVCEVVRKRKCKKRTHHKKNHNARARGNKPRQSYSKSPNWEWFHVRKQWQAFFISNAG